MKIYTRTGDDGTTGLFAGPRVRKDDPRIEAYGSVDELNALLGVARCEETMPSDMEHLLEAIQRELFSLGAELATPDPDAHGTHLITEAQITMLEAAIDHYEERLEPLRQFILPGGTKAAAQLHVARTVARRAERHVVTLAGEADAGISPWLTIYLNRLSDLLFVLARAANAAAGQADVAWKKEGSG